jgi:hypothetical protein
MVSLPEVPNVHDDVREDVRKCAHYRGVAAITRPSLIRFRPGAVGCPLPRYCNVSLTRDVR